MTVEKPLMSMEPEGEKKQTEQAEKPVVPGGVPIDAPAEKKDQPPIKPTENVSASDKEFMKKHGGAMYDLSQIPGYENKGYKCPVYVNMPPDMSKFGGKKPRIIFYAHGNGEQDLEKSKYIMQEVERMRANGDPVILVRPVDATAAPKKNWQEFTKPQIFTDLMKVTERLAGRPVANDISLAGFSGGFKALGETLKQLRARAKEDPEAARMYSRVKRVGLLDAMYGYDAEFAAWARQEGNVLQCTYIPSSEHHVQRMRAAVESSGGKMTMKMVGGSRHHGDAPLDFMAYMSQTIEPGQELPAAEPEKAEETKVAVAEPVAPAEVPAVSLDTTPPPAELPSFEVSKKGAPVEKSGGYVAPSFAKTVPFEGGYTGPGIGKKPESAPTYIPASEPANPEPAPIAPFVPSAPKEHKEVEPGKKGSTLFMGDSITVQIEQAKQFGDFSRTETLAKGGQTSGWLLRKLEERVASNPESVSEFENAVILIGTNDIGGPEKNPRYTADAIFARIEQIWRILIDKGVKVYACTIPPFKGYKTYDKRFKLINERRLAINRMIMASDLPYKKIDLCLGKSQGGLADDEDSDKLAAGFTSDKIHVDKKALGAVYAANVEPHSDAAIEKPGSTQIA